MIVRVLTHRPSLAGEMANWRRQSRSDMRATNNPLTPCRIDVEKQDIVEAESHFESVEPDHSTPGRVKLDHWTRGGAPPLHASQAQEPLADRLAPWARGLSKP